MLEYVFYCSRTNFCLFKWPMATFIQSKSPLPFVKHKMPILNTKNKACS